MHNISFEFYGVKIGITQPLWLKEIIAKDFSYFRTEDGGRHPDIELSVYERKPPFGRIPPVKAVLFQPDSVSYDSGEVRYVDYFGQALSVYDYGKEKGEFYSDDKNLLHELIYLLIQSRVGEMLDKKGIHRVHACGFSINKNGVICLMPQGAGKTTLYLELLKNENIRLVSDDTPLITRGSDMLPFPLRIGVTEGVKLNVPQEFLSTLERRKYGKKILIDTKYFTDRISATVKLNIILKGEREYSDNPRIVKAGKIKIFAALFRDCIVGLGLPQMVEYFLRFQPKDMLAKINIVSSRVIACTKAVLRARTYSIILGTNPQHNAEVMISFIKDFKR